MYRKRILAFIMVLLMVLSFAACGNSAPAAQEAPAADAPAEAASAEAVVLNEDGFDPRLIGRWRVVKVEDNGQTDCKISDYSSFYFLYDGTVYGSYTANSTYADSPDGTAKVDGNNIVIPYYTSIENTELSMSYQISDTTKSLLDKPDKDAEMFYKNCPDDLMTLHVTGSYKDSPTNILSIDSTVTLQLEQPRWYSVFIDTMCGSWVDNYGNSWSFSHDKNGAQDYSFKMTTDDKTEYKGSYIILTHSKDAPAESVRFSFEDYSVDVSAQIVSFDGYVLELTQESGNPLTLTRVDAPAQAAPAEAQAEPPVPAEAPAESSDPGEAPAESPTPAA